MKSPGVILSHFVEAIHDDHDGFAAVETLKGWNDLFLQFAN